MDCNKSKEVTPLVTMILLNKTLHEIVGCQQEEEEVESEVLEILQVISNWQGFLSNRAALVTKRNLI